MTAHPFGNVPFTLPPSSLKESTKLTRGTILKLRRRAREASQLAQALKDAGHYAAAHEMTEVAILTAAALEHLVQGFKILGDRR